MDQLFHYMPVAAGIVFCELYWFAQTRQGLVGENDTPIHEPFVLGYVNGKTLNYY